MKCTIWIRILKKLMMQKGLFTTCLSVLFGSFIGFICTIGFMGFFTMDHTTTSNDNYSERKTTQLDDIKPTSERMDHVTAWTIGQETHQKHREPNSKEIINRNRKEIVMTDVSLSQKDNESVSRYFIDKDSIVNNVNQDRLQNYFNGTRQFNFVCISPRSHRLALSSMRKEEVKLAMSTLKAAPVGQKVIETNSFSFVSGDSFLLRDVCSLGHFPKDISHLFTYVWTEVMAIVDGKQGKSGHKPLQDTFGDVFGNNNSKGEDPLESLYHKLAPRLVNHIILGHKCVTRRSPLIPPKPEERGAKYNAGDPKHTPVFHKVMVHWIRAIMFPWLHRTGMENQIFYEDLTKLVGDAKLFPLGNSQHPLQHPISFYEDYFMRNNGENRSKNKRICFQRVLEREEKWRWFPNAEVAHRFRVLFWRYFRPLKEYHEKRLRNVLQIPFPRQNKLKLLILKRDEDRHFDENVVAQYLQAKFGTVADIKLVQYDRGPKGGIHGKFPSYYEQMIDLSQADILVAAHGAALSSVVVMRPGAVVIELFPHNFRYFMFEELSRLLNLNYVAYEGTSVSPAGCCRGQLWDETATPLHAGGNDSLTSWSESLENSTDDLSLSSRRPVSREERLKILSKMYDLNGYRPCKDCDIKLPMSYWYLLIKNAIGTVLLQNSRLSNIHDFDIRK
eukprot:Tbor_TRINITY_DN2048_c0_g1::TRINITY_DN2048_c0_g1_i1::g.12050::m.12050